VGPVQCRRAPPGRCPSGSNWIRPSFPMATPPTS
jgi:hypothetical protein